MKERQKLTVDALRYYVPIFQKGDQALDRLYSSDLSPGERNKLETIASLRDLATRKITELSKPLLIREINNILSTSHLRYSDEDLFDLLFYAGVNGIIKGLKKFDVNKINKSATNYILQWFSVYSKRELLIHEAAPFNIPPSRFAIYKKISAVRKKLSEILEREATNEEIYDYFQTGKAEVKSLNGPVKKPKVKVSKANQRITLELIKEQENYEENFHHIYLVDPVDDFGTLRAETKEIFNETLFGVFLEYYNFTEDASLVLKSMLNLNTSDMDITNISKSLYNKLEKAWQKLLVDINGPFYNFLIKVESEGFIGFDIEKIIRKIELSKEKIQKQEYLILFKGDQIEHY